MKNKIISLSLVALLLISPFNAGALSFEKTNSTSSSQWKDPMSNMTYTNFGSVSFKFKKNVTSFAPWVKLRPPGISAGCGGISLDAGFAAFLDLETIGKQLEQAISSVGMGVIVVLLQTMPSIAKAFEDVQKLIRKIQSLLQNACQLTVQGLSNSPGVKRAKKNMQDSVNDNAGINAFNGMMEGAAAKVDKVEKALSCPSGDKACFANQVTHFLLGHGKTDPKPKSTSVATLPSKNLKEAILSIMGKDDLGEVYKDTITNVLKNNKYKNRNLNLSTEARQYIKFKMAMFGFLAIKASNGFNSTDVLKDDGTVDTKKLAMFLETNKTPPSYTVIFTDPIGTPDDIFKFLTGKGITGTKTNSLFIPTKLSIRVGVYGDESTNKAGPSGNLKIFQYLEMDSGYNENDKDELEWSGIENATYTTILHALDEKKYAAPDVPMGVFMPKGNSYVNMIKKYSKKEDYPRYADFLAKINVKYAILGLMREAKREALKIAHDVTSAGNGSAYNEYIKNMEDTIKVVKDRLVDYSGDVIHLNNLDQIFNGMKQESLQRRLKRSRGE